MKIYIKHMLSSAADWRGEYEIDENKKTVEIASDWFDYSMCLHLILDLKNEGVDCVRDDASHVGWTPYPPYKTFLTMSGLRFTVATHKLVGIGSQKDRYTIVLTVVPQE